MFYLTDKIVHSLTYNLNGIKFKVRPILKYCDLKTQNNKINLCCFIFCIQHAFNYFTHNNCCVII